MIREDYRSLYVTASQCAHTAWACIVYTSVAPCMHLSVSNLLLSQSILKAIREYREHV